MTDDEEVVTEAPELIGVGAQAVTEQARRLGISWGWQPATVVTSSPLTAQYDGDTVPIGMTSVIGTPAVGARVAVIFVPPAGNYIVGLLTGSAPSTMTNNEPATSPGIVTLTTAQQLYLSSTVTVTGAAEWEAVAFVDFDCTVAGTTICVGTFFLDGVGFSRPITFGVAATSDRASPGGLWTSLTGGVLSAGTHLFELWVSKTINVATVRALTGSMTVKTWE